MKLQTKIMLAGMAVGYVYANSLLQPRSYNFYKKRVLITGGSRGLGLLLAREFLKRGAQPILIARDLEALQRAQAELQQVSAQEVPIFTCDLRDPQQITATVNEVLKTGPIDILVNNAGIIEVGSAFDMKMEDFEEAMQLHFWGPLRMMMDVLPHMLERRRGGRIVNISSIGGRVAIPHLAPYSASKFALAGISDALRNELASHRIAVTTVSPGLMRTGSHINATFKGSHQNEFAWFAVSASNPFISMDGRRAARSIVKATARGTPSLVVGLPARILILADAMFPGVVSRALSLVNNFLPKPSGDTRHYTGWESKSKWAPSALTALGDKQISRNNELQGHSEGELLPEA